MKREQQETHEMLYGTKPDPVTEALFILGAREKETLPDVCRRRMRELGKEPGTPPVAQDSRLG
jgi:hypothetical protein